MSPRNAAHSKRRLPANSEGLACGESLCSYEHDSLIQIPCFFPRHHCLAWIMPMYGFWNGSVAVFAMLSLNSQGSRYNLYIPVPSLHFTVFLKVMTLDTLEGG